MKKKLALMFLAVGLLLAPLLLIASPAHAIDFRSGDSVRVEKGQKIDSTLFAAGDSIEIAGEVNGDVICAGATVNITGTVRGDIICAAQDMRLTGNVDGDVRLAGEKIELGSVVAGRASIASSDLRLERTGSVEDISVAANQAIFEGAVLRDLAVTGKNVTISGNVKRNVQADVTQLSLASDARIGGDVTYKSDNRIAQSQGAQVEGEITRQARDTSGEPGLAEVLAGLFFLLLMLLVMSMALVAAFPRAMQGISDQGVYGLGRSVLTGLVAVFLAPGLIFLLLVSIFGSLLGVTLLLVYLLMLLVSGPIFAYYIGRLLMTKRSRNPLVYMLVGSLVMLLLYIIPVVNIFALLVAGVLGSGMLIQAVVRAAKSPVYDVGEIEAGKSKGKPRTAARAVSNKRSK